MNDHYFYYYVLSYFDEQKITGLSQILHVFRGKRTPSMFYVTEINKWHHGFSLEKRMTQEKLSSIIQRLLAKQLIIAKEKGYILTKQGKERCGAYFKEHYFPHKTNSFSSINLHRPFWDRMQLFTQVFSEYSYQNTQYIPVIKHPHHQENVRQLFQVTQGNKDKVLDQWVKEQELLFEKLEPQSADTLVNFLTGHHQIGKTRTQMAKHYQMTPYEFRFYLMDTLEEAITIIKKQQSKMILTREILKQVNAETFYGLSRSTYQTYQMLKQGATIDQIAQQRRIKENTVKEHILEIAFVFDKFPTQKFIPHETYDHLLNKFDQQKKYTYKKAVSENNELEFYHYRLIELERMRAN